MKFLCLAYGDAKDWDALSRTQQEELLRQDEALRQRGTLMAATKTRVITVTAWDGKPRATDGPFASSNAPLAGCSVIDASSADEVIQLVANTPCARAKGAIEIRPIMAINDYQVGEKGR